MLQAVWSGRIVSESTITSHINAVRKAVGDNGEAQRLVRTVARKGYRFIGKIESGNVQKTLDPSLRVCNLRDWLPVQRAEDFTLLVEGLRLAELPE